MGFLADWLGQKLIGTIEIKFYGEEEASVQYNTQVTDNNQIEKDLMQLFTLYYARTLHDLGHSGEADALIAYIDTAIEEVLKESDNKRLSILGTGIKLVEIKDSPVKKLWSGQLLEKSKNRFIITHSTRVGEGYYAPVSTIMFFQYLVNNLSLPVLQFLLVSVGGINKYYREVDGYWKMASINEAPSYGIKLAMQFFSSLESK